MRTYDDKLYELKGYYIFTIQGIFSRVLNSSDINHIQNQMNVIVSGVEVLCVCLYKTELIQCETIPLLLLILKDDNELLQGDFSRLHIYSIILATVKQDPGEWN